MHPAQFILIALSSAIMAGCSMLPQISPTPVPVTSIPPTATAPLAKPKIALALGGGAARGFAHIGVLKVLEANGIVPDMVVGTSAGAVVGALYAGGHDPASLQRIAQRLDESLLADWTFVGTGLLKGEALQDFVNQRLRQRVIEQLPKPFAAVATDLKTGRSVVFRTGDVGLAVRASAAVPGVFQPAHFRGQTYVDGGLTSPVPVKAAREMGADIVIAVDISAQAEGQPIDNVTNILWQTITVMGSVIADIETAKADVLIRPHMPYVKSWDFKARHRAVLEGEVAAQATLQKIRQKISDWK